MEMVMKTKFILPGLVLLATSTFMVACSNNKTTSTSGSSTTEQTSIKTNDLQNYIKNHQELIKLTRAGFYLGGMAQDYRKTEGEAEKKGEQVFLTPNDVDKRLRKLKVEIGEYNNGTKRLAVTVTNNYSEDVLGYNDNKDSDIEHQTSIRIKGYFKEQAGVKPSELLISFRPKVTIKSGESVTFQILMPYYDYTDNKDAVTSLKNEEYDSMYILSDYLESILIYPNNDQNKLGRSAMSNFGNYFVDNSLYFKNYPNEASISYEEIVERYGLMKK
jgi:lipoprotein